MGLRPARTSSCHAVVRLVQIEEPVQIAARAGTERQTVGAAFDARLYRLRSATSAPSG